MSINASSQALARLEPYLLLAKTAKSAAAAKLINEVTSAQGCYVFSELLDLEGIKSLQNDEEYSKSYHLLQLFAYGSFRDYISSPSGTYSKLNEAQIEKLRHLTLISLGSQNRNLSYDLLIKELGLDDGQQDNETQSNELMPSSSSNQISVRKIQIGAMRKLEDVIIDAIYAGIINARLDQSRQRVEVESVLGRDVRGEEGVQILSDALHDWQERTMQMLNTLSQRIQEARQHDEKKELDRLNSGSKIEKTLLHLFNNPNLGSQNISTTGSRVMYDRLGSDRFGGDVEMEDDPSALRKKKLSSAGPSRSKRSRA